jgi:hypothetical protein
LQRGSENRAFRQRLALPLNETAEDKFFDTTRNESRHQEAKRLGHILCNHRAKSGGIVLEGSKNTFERVPMTAIISTALKATLRSPMIVRQLFHFAPTTSCQERSKNETELQEGSSVLRCAADFAAQSL